MPLTATRSFAPATAPGSVAPLLSVEGVTLQYKTEQQSVTAVYRVSFQAAKADRLILLGPSGCGKSTILKAIAGFVRPAEGRIRLAGREITGPGPDRVVVFQEFEQLLPWKTVKENIEFALTVTGGFSRREAASIAMRHIEKVNLVQFANAYPHTLSGGMKQRVAIARCLAANPDVILMDEPFAALDALTRQRMQNELLRLWRESKFTLVFVTHSINEAIALGNRIVLLSAHPGQVKADLALTAEGIDGKVHPDPAALHDQIEKLLFQGQPDYVI